jgi:hypothetical protein
MFCKAFSAILIKFYFTNSMTDKEKFDDVVALGFGAI